MDAYEMSEVMESRRESGELYLEFFSAPGMSLGVYELPAGSSDPQQPHGEDEVYYVAAGRGHIRVAGEDRALRPGSIVFVGAEVEHRFHSITENLTLLVVFAPARGTGRRT